jgi:hypothetical protein
MCATEARRESCHSELGDVISLLDQAQAMMDRIKLRRDLGARLQDVIDRLAELRAWSRPPPPFIGGSQQLGSPPVRHDECMTVRDRPRV